MGLGGWGGLGYWFICTGAIPGQHMFKLVYIVYGTTSNDTPFHKRLSPYVVMKRPPLKFTPFPT
jgi:hypothetical protein